jgi:uncharacterized protein YjlB
MSSQGRRRSEPDITERYTFADDGVIPNSTLPVLVYRHVLQEAELSAQRLIALFGQHGWSNAWEDGIYDYTHFHSNTHEVLGVADGAVRVRLGGEHGASIDLEPGDVVILPAGTGHRAETASEDLLVVGAYPDGLDFDIRRGAPGERAEVLANLASVARPRQDPVTGPTGLLLELWS